MPYDANGNWMWGDDEPVMGNPYPDFDIFPPANTGDIIGNTGPGVGWGDIDQGFGTFRGTPTYGQNPIPDDTFGPANTGDIIGNSQSGGNLGRAPINWGGIGRRILQGIGTPTGGPQRPGQNQNMLPAIARILQGLSKGRAEGRITEAEMARLYDYLNLARTRTFYDRAGQELDQRKWAQDLQERSAKQAAKGSFLQNYQPAPSSLPPEMARFSGPRARGLESIPQAQRDEIGGSMYRNAITELLDPLQPGTATTGRRMAALPAPEPISPTPEAGRFDDFLNWASIIMGGLYPTQPTPQQPPQQTPTRTPPAEPPAEIPPRRSPNSTLPTAPGQRPYIGDVNIDAPGRAELSTTARSLTPFDNTSAPTGLTGDAGLSAGLPQISNMVRDVPGPNVGTLGPYDDPYGRRRRT